MNLTACCIISAGNRKRCPGLAYAGAPIWVLRSASIASRQSSSAPGIGVLADQLDVDAGCGRNIWPTTLGCHGRDAFAFGQREAISIAER
jgi:hypothetical protein